MQWPSFCCSHCCHTCHPCNWAESLFIVKAITLCISLGNYPCLLLAYRPISIVLYLVNPLISNSLLTKRQCYQLLSAVCIQSYHFLIHGCTKKYGCRDQMRTIISFYAWCTCELEHTALWVAHTTSNRHEKHKGSTCLKSPTKFHPDSMVENMDVEVVRIFFFSFTRGACVNWHYVPCK